MSDKRNTIVYKANNDLATIEAVVAQLTEKGRDAMNSIGRGWVSFFDNGIVEGSGIWGECLTADLGLKSSGVINRLRDLGLFVAYDTKDDDYASGMWWDLTALGADVANYLAENLEGHNDADADESVAADPKITVKTGSKWTYIYAADGSLLAEIRNDAAWLLDAAVLAACAS